MKRWPSDSFEIQTSMSLEEIIERLNAEIEHSGLFRQHKAFQGEISREGFKITRSIRSHNFSLPIVRGSFKPGQSGVSVAIKMGLHPLATIFLCVWYACILGFMGDFIKLLKGRVQIHPTDFIPIVLLIFPWAMASAGFWFEAKEEKQMLINILKQKITSERVGAVDRQ